MLSATIEVDTDQVILEAARLVKVASVACKKWECTGIPEAVSDTAADALDISHSVIRLEAEETGEPMIDQFPETRRGRLLAAAWLLVLAGTDEHGESLDLAIASKLLCQAAEA